MDGSIGYTVKSIPYLFVHACVRASVGKDSHITTELLGEQIEGLGPLLIIDVTSFAVVL